MFLSGATRESAPAGVSSVVGEGKTIRGNVTGSARRLIDVPRYTAMAANGDPPLSELLDAAYGLEGTETARANLADGAVIKPVLPYT